VRYLYIALDRLSILSIFAGSSLWRQSILWVAGGRKPTSLLQYGAHDATIESSKWRPKMKNKLACFAAIVFSNTVQCYAADVRSVTLGSVTLRVPGRFFLDSAPIPSWLRWLPGLDSGSRELLLSIQASEVAEAISSYKVRNDKFEEDIPVRIAVLTDTEVQRYTDPSQFSAIWTRSGSYHDAIVEFDAETKHYRAYRRIEYPWSWEEFTVAPDRLVSTDILKFWIGHCLGSRGARTSSGYLASCQSFIIHHNVQLEYTIGLQNISLTGEIRKYLAALLSEWIQPSDTP
jgi:hypothetical protein